MKKYNVIPASVEKQKQIKEMFKEFKQFENASQDHKDFFKGVEKHFKKNKDVSQSQFNYLEYILEQYKNKQICSAQ